MGRAEVALTVAGKGLRERIRTNRIYCSLKERCKKRMRMRVGGGGGCRWLRVSGRQKGRCKLLAAGVQMEIVRPGQPTGGGGGCKWERVRVSDTKENPVVQVKVRPAEREASCFRRSGCFLATPILRFHFLMKQTQTGLNPLQGDVNSPRPPPTCRPTWFSQGENDISPHETHDSASGRAGRA